METLKLYDITNSSPAWEYFRKQLQMGTTLAARITEAVDFSLGKMFAALPEEVDLGDLPRFEETGTMQWRRRGFATLAQLVKRFLAISGAVVLLQDTIASPSEDWLRDWENRDIVSYNQEVYWRLANPTLDEEDILSLLYSATFHPWSAFFYVQGHPGRSSVLSDTDLDEIVKTLSGVAVGVFDQESFLLWWSDRLPTPTDLNSP